MFVKKIFNFMFEIIWIFFYFSLFQIFGPIYEILFCPIFANFRGSINMYIEARVSRWCSIKEKATGIYYGSRFLQTLKTLTAILCSYMFFTGANLWF